MSRCRSVARALALLPLVLVWLAVMHGDALAQATSTTLKSAEAKQHLDWGLRAFEKHDYTEAVAEFRAGYAVEPGADFLYALGQAERLRGNCKAAVEAYRAFLDTHPPATETTLARENLEKCDAALDKNEMRTSTGPATAPVAPPPPVTMAPPLAPSTSPPVSEAPPSTVRPFYTDVLGDLLGAGGIVGLGLGVTFAVLGNGDALSSRQAGAYDAAVGDADSAKSERVVAVVSASIGVALVVASIIRFATRPHETTTAVAR